MEMVDLLRTSGSWLRLAIFSDMELVERAIGEVSEKLLFNPEIILFGKTAHQHRSVGFFSNDTIGYQYSGTTAPSQPLTPCLASLLTQVNELFESSYNGILINFYSNGSDYIGAHSDDERFLGPLGVISLSYGTTRKFRIRDRSTREIVMDVPVPSGALLHMGGDFQKEFTHEVPMEKRIREGRYSFTFRQHLR
jgi:alkylated DNA repair dioxygenase AlkB